MHPAMTEHERYLFNLRGYIVIPNALSPEPMLMIDKEWLAEEERKLGS